MIRRRLCLTSALVVSVTVAGGCNDDPDNAPVLYPDASVPADLSVVADLAVTPPDLTVVTPLRCGDTSGLQPGAPWPMVGQCPARQGRSLFPGPSLPRQRWAVSVWQEGGTIVGSPVVDAGERVYFASRHGIVHAVDGHSGTEKWTATLSFHPVVSARGTLLVETNQFNISGSLRALDPATGQMTWQSGSFGRIVGPLVPGVAGALHLADADGVIRTFSDVDGKEQWNRQITAVGEQPPTAPTLLDKGVVVGTTDRTANSHLISLGADGKPRWQASASQVVRDPVVDTDAVYAVTTDGLEAFDAGGKHRFTHPAPAAASFEPAIGGDGTVYFATGRTLLALDPATFTVRWTFDAGAAVTTAPVIDAGGTVYVGAADKNLWAVDGTTGKSRWSFQAGAGITAGLALGNGSLYLGSDDGNVYGIGP